MSSNKTRFQKKLIAAAVASCAMSGVYHSASAQEDGAQALEEVVVVGVRGAQESAINTKRDAASVVDGISAEDIGKLPDVTIADSLQRISGVQIRRSAGEGSSINVRGLPQVVTQLNGEQYLGANSVTSNQPNFSDIPSHLFSGADVHKSPTADQGSAGITGTVNLKTFRPFDFDPGMTSSFGVEVQTGEETGETDPVINGLVNWNSDNAGFLLSGSYANVNLANYYNGVNSGGASGDTGWTGNTSVGLQGDLDGTYIAPHGYAAWNNVVERERLGLNASFQADLGGGFEFIVDAFYTEQDEYDRKVGLSHTNKWQGSDFIQPLITSGTGVDDWRTFQEVAVEGVRLKSFTQNDGTFSSSTNINMELNYDNGGPFTGSIRFVQGRADQERRHGYNEGDLTDGSTTGIDPYYPETGFTSPNPNGYSENPRTIVNTQGEHMHWSGFDNSLAGAKGASATIADYMADVDAYNIGAYSSENNYNRGGEMDVFRADGSYEFDGSVITSIDFGVRNSSRTASNFAYQLTSGLYEDEAFYLPEDGDLNNPDDWQDVGDVGGCQVQWKATDVVLGEGPGFCNAGEIVDGEFQGYTALPPTPLGEDANTMWVTDFGPVTGVPGVWAVDPEAYDDPEAFHKRVFGDNSAKQVIPGQSYDVILDELQTYFQVNFQHGIASGNVGARIVDTSLHVRQNDVAGKIPYGNLNEDVGDINTNRSYTDVLPSANLAFDLRDDVTLRFAYSENMVPLDLNSWGESLVLDYTIDSEEGSETEGDFIVSGGNQGGDPSFDPWRSNNFDASLEWYTGPASMMHVGYFLVEVDSFIGEGNEQQFQPDADGVARRQVSIGVPQQGEGGELEGVEMGIKQAFTFLPGGWSNFGMDANYTLSLSEQDERDINGEKLAFPDNSEHQANLVGWYQSERFQARIAYNYRSERLHSTGQAWSNLATYQDEIGYVDVSASYDLTDEVTVYVNGSNVTGEYDDYYLQWEDQYATQSYYEPRWSLGVRARF